MGRTRLRRVMAEEEGFERSRSMPLPAFEGDALGRSACPPVPQGAADLRSCRSVVALCVRQCRAVSGLWSSRCHPAGSCRESCPCQDGGVENPVAGHVLHDLSVPGWTHNGARRRSDRQDVAGARHVPIGVTNHGPRGQLPAYQVLRRQEGVGRGHHGRGPAADHQRGAGGKLLGVSRRSAYRAVAHGEIPTVRVGRRLLVPTGRLLGMLSMPPAT